MTALDSLDPIHGHATVTAGFARPSVGPGGQAALCSVGEAKKVIGAGDPSPVASLSWALS